MLKKNNREKSDMYKFVTDNWNPVRGKCPYECTYCYVGRWGNVPKPLFLDQKYLRDNLGTGRYIFICSGCDLFHPDIPVEWINAVRERTLLYPGNTYLWHTKNPYRLVSLIEPGRPDIACVTIESNREYPLISKAPRPIERAAYLEKWEGKRMITVEPILDFDVTFVNMILQTNPMQVNIGADTGNNGLPEPPSWKIRALIETLEKHTKVHCKKNLERLLNA